MDRAKLTIKASVKQWEKYWEVIDRKWEGQLHETFACYGNRKKIFIYLSSPNEEGKGTVHEDDSVINRRVSRRISNATQERDIDSVIKVSSDVAIMGVVDRVVALVGTVEELVALVRVLEEMVARWRLC
ncbi:hypothetical protein AAG906_021233 [Vitis piasezkii]